MPIDGELSVPQDGFNVDCYGLSYARKEESSRCCSVAATCSAVEAASAPAMRRAYRRVMAQSIAVEKS